MDPMLLVFSLIAAFLGYIVCFLQMRSTRNRLDQDLHAERERSAGLEAENKRMPALDTKIASLTDAILTVEKQSSTFKTQADRVPILEQALEGAKITNDELFGANKTLKAELANERANYEKQEQLADRFEAISNQVLSKNSTAFLTLAEQKLGQYQEGAKGDLEKRQQAINELLKPLKENLSKLDDTNREMERLRTDAYATLVSQVDHLRLSDELSRQEITKLISTLDSPKPRGDWGEEQLRRIVELAGMSEYCNFDVQVHLKGDSTYRADMIVRLAGGKSIIVDAKAPWDREVFQSDDSKERQIKISIMCSNFKKHIDELWKRDYSSLVQDSPDFVVMFVPIEPVFHLVLQTDPSLISYAISKKVVLASPTTLIAMLKSVAYGWQQDAISQNAQKISSLGKELYERFGVFGKYLSNVGKNLNDTVKSYNDLLNSTESRLLVSARRFKELKVSSDSEITESRPVETIAAFPSAYEIQPTGKLFENPV